MKLRAFLLMLLIPAAVLSQKKEPANWQLLDPETDKIYGAGVEEAYKLLKDRKPVPVIVAVIDGGTDTEHEDLKQVIWINEDEVPGNGIDDDKNGYIDDVHGWSFLGGKNGDIDHEATELARMVRRMDKRFANADPATLDSTGKADYARYQELKEIFRKEQAETQQQLMSISVVSDFLEKVKKQSGGKINKKALKKYKTENELEAQIKKGLKLAFTFGLKPEELEGQLKEGRDHFEGLMKFNSLDADSMRQHVVGDNVNDPYERYYGNNNVKGPDAVHGSHVAGIIAAVRNNQKGLNGVTNDVRIMVLRAVPNGDERDKDVANAIRYAVDNGAKVINMSFGKYYSPEKNVVDEAVRYALSKDVLLVHAAGNESKNKDIEQSYPAREFSQTESAPNWLEVGANGYKASSLAGDFSNYGRTRVDLFAPGVNIYSTIPDNKYLVESGTSMASPTAAGVAALIRSYFPELTAAQVRELLMSTVTKYEKEIPMPGESKKKTLISELCISGGVINAENAVRKLLQK